MRLIAVASRLRFSGPIVSCVATLLLSAAAVVRTEAACSAQEAASFRFSVTSRRNETRHRIVTVDLASDVPTADDGRNSHSQVSLDVSHEYSQCGGVERVHVGTVASAEEAKLHRSDYELFPGVGYYKLHTTGQLWEEARSMCVSEQAHLIIINSDKEANVIKEFLSRHPKIQAATNGEYILSGFHDKFVEGQYVTLTGEPLSTTSYVKWGSGQPTKGTGENYGGVDRVGLLHDIPNVWKLAFVCEQEF